MDLTISRILVPVDFSAHSDHALRYALALAGRLGATVHVLHVVEDPIATGAWGGETVIPNLTELRQELLEEAERRLADCRREAAAARVPIVAEARLGLTSHSIVDYANTCAVDLIVMGTHGRTGVAHLLMGSVAERVLRYAPCPVLTMRAGVRTDEVHEAMAHATV